MKTHIEGIADEMIANNLTPFIPTHPKYDMDLAKKNPKLTTRLNNIREIAAVF